MRTNVAGHQYFFLFAHLFSFENARGAFSLRSQNKCRSRPPPEAFTRAYCLRFRPIYSGVWVYLFGVLLSYITPFGSMLGSMWYLHTCTTRIGHVLCTNETLSAGVTQDGGKTLPVLPGAFFCGTSKNFCLLLAPSFPLLRCCCLLKYSEMCTKQFSMSAAV